MRHGIRFNSLYKANLNNLLPLLLWLLVLQILFNCGHGILFIYIANQPSSRGREHGMVLTEIRVEAGKIVLHSGDHDHQRTGAQAEQHQQPVAGAE